MQESHNQPPIPPSGGYQPPQDNKKLLAGILGILFGCFGVHKFILGYTTEGLIMLALCLCSFGTIPTIIGIVEGIIYLTKTDQEFYQTYVANKRGWF